MDRKTREELNSLSKKVFGSERKWQKLMEKGFPELFTRDREVMVPDLNGGFKKKVFTDKKYISKRYTAEEIKELMLNILGERKESALISGYVQPMEASDALTLTDGSTPTVASS